MGDADLNFEVSNLGECHVASAVTGVRFVGDDERLLYHSDLRDLRRYLDAGDTPPQMELAGPRRQIFVDPAELKCGVVTCGGLCPGLNDVVRAIALSLYWRYGVRTVYGFRFGFEGLTRHDPVELTPQTVSDIHQMGGSMLGSSRGEQDVGEMVDALERLGVGALFVIGGDGSLRGAGAIAAEVRQRGLKIAVVGVPKTIDNDISFIERSFGFETAVSEAKRATIAANSEATGARNGIGLVKLMGRDSGFIAAHTVLSDNDVNFCLVPEVTFTMKGFLAALRHRLEAKGNAVIVVAEGAGRELIGDTGERDASGNVRYEDIGGFLKNRIEAHFDALGVEITLKYIDPSYIIRAVPANASDSAFSLLLGHNAVHAAMAGRTDMVVGYWKNEFVHVPIRLAVSERKRIDPEGWMWTSVLGTTGQPAAM